MFRGRSIDHVDRRTLQLTIALLALSLLASLFPSGSGDPLTTFAALLTFSLLIVGLYVLLMRGWKELGVGRAFLRLAPWSMGVCSILSIAFLLMYEPGFYDVIIGDTEFYGLAAILLAGVVSGVVLGMVLLLIVIYEIVLCYGVVGIFSVIAKPAYPRILIMLRGIDTSARLSIGDRLMLWMFSIPDVLDPGSLTTTDPSERPIDRRGDLRVAVMWQMAIGTLVLLYVSLNPLLDLDLAWAVGLISSLSVLIPMVVLPMFPLRSISAELGAPIRPFALFDGVKARMGGLVSLVGTIIIFLRLTLQEADLVQLLQRFFGFYLFFMTLSIVSSLVYFRVFDQEISEHVHRYLSSRE